jgi:hypothetical protein
MFTRIDPRKDKCSPRLGRVQICNGQWRFYDGYLAASTNARTAVHRATRQSIRNVTSGRQYAKVVALSTGEGA